MGLQANKGAVPPEEEGTASFFRGEALPEEAAGMLDKFTGFTLGIVTIVAAVAFAGGIIEGAAHTRPNRWTIALDQLYHGTNS